MGPKLLDFGQNIIVLYEKLYKMEILYIYISLLIILILTSDKNFGII